MFPFKEKERKYMRNFLLVQIVVFKICFIHLMLCVEFKYHIWFCERYRVSKQEPACIFFIQLVKDLSFGLSVCLSNNCMIRHGHALSWRIGLFTSPSYIHDTKKGRTGMSLLSYTNYLV